MRILIAILSVLFMSLACAHAQQLGHHAAEGLPSYVRILPDEVQDGDFDMPDSLFYQLSGRTIFIVNKYFLRPGDPFIAELRDSVLPEIRRRDMELVGMVLRGAASPEGPYYNNVMLSENRAKALTDFLNKEVGQEFTRILNTQTMAEDYDYLLLLLEEANDLDFEKVKALLEPCGGDAFACKKALQKADGGKLWRRLLNEYFPALRAARIVLFFKKKTPEKKHAAVSEAPKPWTLDIPAVGMPAIAPFRPVDIERDRPHMLSVSTNLLYDGFYLPNYGWAPTPNIGVEFYPRHGNWTLFGQFTFPYYHRWHRHKFYQIRDYHLEGRWYFNPGDTHKGLFVGAYANANIYGIGFSKTKGWEGEGIGGAVKVGYVFNIGRRGRWRLELSAAAGGYYTKFDPYVYGNPLDGTEDGKYYYDYTGQLSKFKKRDHNRIWIGPTELNITIRYDILYYKLSKKGASARRKEKITSY